MGARGPKPKPTRLKVLEGNPGKRRLNRKEQKPERGIPPCPGWLCAEAKREWRRISPELHRLGLLTLVDLGVLAGYCQAWARWAEAERFIEENGSTMTLRDDKGNVKWVQAVPQVAIGVKMLEKVRQFGAELGLSPSSRTRLEAEALPSPEPVKVDGW